MSKPKDTRQTKSAPTQPAREPIEIEVRFCAPDPAPLAFPGCQPAAVPAKKKNRPERPGVTFRF